MNSDGSGWAVIEDESYERAIASLGSHQEMDIVLAPIIYALHKNPLGFTMTHIKDVYLAKTRIRINKGNYIPSYRLWFNADAVAMQVRLLYVEIAPPEDMGYGDIFDAEGDDISF